MTARTGDLAELEAYDLTDLDLFAQGFPHHVFALHRSVAPIRWHEPTMHTPDGDGFWSVATHAESLEVLHDPVTFSSEKGGHRTQGGTILADGPAAGRALNMMDDPRHHRVRRLVSRGFTPRMIGARLEDDLRRRCTAIVDGLCDRREADFLVELAAEIPLQAICILMGIPEEDRHRLGRWIHHVFDFEGRAAFESTDEVRAAQQAMLEYGVALLEEKRRRPADDMLSVVVHASLPDEDPSTLTGEELLAFFTLLFAAGSDTTRSATAGGLLALVQHPAELARLRADPALLATAIEEMVRWTSPAAYNRRTATRDVTFHGFPIRAGDKVVFWEASANRDDLAFGDGSAFRVDRDPNPHLGFGHGIHHCLGANLARLEMRVVFEEVLARLDDLELAGPPEFARSNKHNGLRHLPIRYVPRSAP